MSQKWHYIAIVVDPNVKDVNEALTKWATVGWELVSASYGGGPYQVYADTKRTRLANKMMGEVWLFWRTPAKESD